MPHGCWRVALIALYQDIRRVTPALESLTPGSRLRVYRGVLAWQVVECLAVDDEHGIVRALWEALGRRVEC